MGLDQNAFAVDKKNKKIELCYWRKHPNLQGWMENLWQSKGCPNPNENDPEVFNCVDLELTADDIDNFEKDMLSESLPETTGFFFGENSDEHYKEQDAEFVVKARKELKKGNKVFYSSWW